MRTAPWILLAAAMMLLTLGTLPARAQIGERRLPIQVVNPGAAPASPLTLVVPLSLENIQPEIAMVTLTCSISTNGVNYANAGEVRGIAIPASGDLTQDVSVPITFIQGADPTSYEHYQCFVIFCTAANQCQTPGTTAPFQIESGSHIVKGTVNW